MFPRTVLILFAALALVAPAAPAVAQTSDPTAVPPDMTVTRLMAALDAHDVQAATGLLADGAVIIGIDSATGRGQLQRWVQDQVDQGVAIEMTRPHGNGARVTWTARITRADWAREGQATRYVDEEAAVTASHVTVVGAHYRSPNTLPSEPLSLVRAATLARSGNLDAPTPRGATFALLALIGLGLVTGLYAASSASPGGASAQKGRLLHALRASSQLRPRHGATKPRGTYAET